MKDKINFNVAIIGMGRIGKIHYETMKNISGINIVTLSDIYAEEDWKNIYGVNNVETDYNRVLEDDGIDTVFICSSTNTHADIIKKAAKANKNIFCEKPISLSLEETIEVAKIVKETGVNFQVGFMRRYDKYFDEAYQMVHNDEIGNLNMLKITSRDPEPPSYDYVKNSGGVFMDMSIHDYDQARYITQDEVDEVFVSGNALVNPELEKLDDIDTLVTILTFKNGTIGIIDNCRNGISGYDQRLEILGTEAVINIDNVTEGTAKVGRTGKVTTSKPVHFFLERYADAYKQETIDFFKRIKNQQPLKCTIEDGVMAQVIATAAKESHLTNQPVKVDSILEKYSL